MQNKTRTPVWNEVLELHGYSAADPPPHEASGAGWAPRTALRLSLWDEDQGRLRELFSTSNDLLGWATHDLAHLGVDGAPTPPGLPPLSRGEATFGYSPLIPGWDRCCKNEPALCTNGTCVTASSEAVPNAFMASPPRHPLFAQLILSLGRAKDVV